MCSLIASNFLTSCLIPIVLLPSLSFSSSISVIPVFLELPLLLDTGRLILVSCSLGIGNLLGRERHFCLDEIVDMSGLLLVGRFLGTLVQNRRLEGLLVGRLRL